MSKNIYYCTNDETISLSRNDMYKHAKCVYAEHAGIAAASYAEAIYDSGNRAELFEGEGLRVWVMQGHTKPAGKMWWFDVSMVMVPEFVASQPHEENNFVNNNTEEI